MPAPSVASKRSSVPHRRFPARYAGALAGALTAMLGACAHQRSVPPPAPAPDAYTHEAPAALEHAGQRFDYATEVPAQWWTQLQSPSLDAVIQLALRGNHDLDAAQANLLAARALAEAATAARYPKVDLTASAGRQKYGAAFLGSFKDPPFSFFSLGPSVSYLVDLAGGVRAGIEQQAAVAVYQRCKFDETYLTLTGNVALQGLAIASARAQIATVKALIEADHTDLELVRTAYADGSANKVDLLDAESQLAAEQTLLPPIEQQLSTARHALALLVGRYPADWNPPDFNLDEFREPTLLPLTLPSQLAHRRPDVLATEAQLRAANAAVGVATANLYPQISLSAAASFQATSPAKLFDVSSAGASFAGNLTAPLFNHGALKARQHAAMQSAQAARATYEQTVLHAFTQVADALEALNHDAEQLDAEQQAVIISTRTLALTRESYADGYATVLQVLQAERAYERSQLGLLQARVQRYADTIQLYLNLGGQAPDRGS